MVSQKYSVAMSEILEYLKGIRKQDIDKIPNELLNFFKENADKDYKCQFDYNKPLKELQLKKETIALIDMICLNYWCENEKYKKMFSNILNANELEYQKKLRKTYNPDNLFKKATEVKKNDKEDICVIAKRNIVQKQIDRIKNFFK